MIYTALFVRDVVHELSPIINLPETKIPDKDNYHQILEGRSIKFHSKMKLN